METSSSHVHTHVHMCARASSTAVVLALSGHFPGVDWAVGSLACLGPTPQAVWPPEESWYAEAAPSWLSQGACVCKTSGPPCFRLLQARGCCSQA